MDQNLSTTNKTTIVGSIKTNWEKDSWYDKHSLFYK